jgi:hypothetical protein
MLKAFDFSFRPQQRLMFLKLHLNVTLNAFAAVVGRRPTDDVGEITTQNRSLFCDFPREE